ncbi:BamA/TamA family outer membrane protein [Flavobacterium proteolyticum]|uniref:POTRA domain-containing protein n=1 Tax=Flavobacterium proteolyticum TaxID=2911683 RepID=A0ABR9WTN4_9FLAO|nr:hypothetical protein [Flavobacterium proteolyticum]MBE9577016.1 hypothetical protein [Flavobacterium proteolyticum]
MKLNLILFFCICIISLKGKAQTVEKKADSISIYQDINDLSKKSKFSRFVYKLIFKESALKAENLVPFKPKKAEKAVKKHQEGKIIRNITIETLDPFGYSVTNEKKVPKRKLENFGNSVHIKTKEITIRNIMLFKKYDKLDAKLLLESERLIRSQRYIREVKIVPVDIPKNKDSIDIKIRVLDSWTLIPTGSLSSSESSVKLTERNILGFGHLISGNVRNRFDTKERAVYAQYSINNIKNTYFRFDLDYANEFNNDSKRSVNINRPFYSVITKNAGGFYFENRLRTEQFPVLDTISLQKVSYDFQEYWYGRAFKINSKSNPERYFTNLVLALTYNQKDYGRLPDATLDPSNYFSNEKNWVGMIGVSRQKFYQDTFVFNYNITEDIPYGENIALIIGHQEKNSNSRMYTGLSVSYGKKCSFGYASGFAEWGSFYDAGLTEQTTFKMGLNYFSPLLSWGKWHFRQFVKPTYVWGNNRDESFKDRLNLLEADGLPGFNNRFNGTQKWTVSFQTQSYIPGSWYGFRFSPYFNTTLGSLANDKALFSSKVYSKFSIGALINNDFLVFNSFQISFSYYPTIPFEGDGINKFNSFENTNLSLYDFQLSKPGYIRYE